METQEYPALTFWDATWEQKYAFLAAPYADLHIPWWLICLYGAALLVISWESCCQGTKQKQN